MQEYEIYESKLNHLSIEEIEDCGFNPFSVVINKIESMASRSNSTDLRHLNYLASVLTAYDVETCSKVKIRYKGIYYDSVNRYYTATKHIKSVKYKIKSSKDYHLVEDALLKFCSEHGIKP